MSVIAAPEHELIVPDEEALEIKPEESLATPVAHELTVSEEESIVLPPVEEIMVPPVQSLAVPANEEVMLTPNQNLVQTVAQSIDVGVVEKEQDGDERPAVFPPSVEQISTAADASWYTPQEEPQHADEPIAEAVEDSPAFVQEEVSAEATPSIQEEVQEEVEDAPPVVEEEVIAPVQQNTPPVVVINPAPPMLDKDISNRILEEAARSKVTPPEELESINTDAVEQIPAEPIVAVPHYAVAQLTPSMHPLALPPRVVPFATMVPAAYPQVAAVFTQPHARASEWLPWMRTSHFSRNAVQVATNPEIHPSYPRYSRPTNVGEAVPTSAVASPVAPLQATAVDIAPVAPQKVFVSVVGKPVAPVAVPIEKHQDVPVPTPKVIPPAEDAWDEMIASQDTRNQTAIGRFEEVPQKSRDELLKEVSADIKDSWDAAFLTGLGAA
jgi:hypothetical protein